MKRFLGLAKRIIWAIVLGLVIIPIFLALNRISEKPINEGKDWDLFWGVYVFREKDDFFSAVYGGKYVGNSKKLLVGKWYPVRNGVMLSIEKGEDSEVLLRLDFNYFQIIPDQIRKLCDREE